jgi:hypothetical protein
MKIHMLKGVCPTLLLAVFGVIFVSTVLEPKQVHSSPAKSPDNSRVTVLPVFFVPKGEAPPTAEQSEKFMRHVRMAQARYKELLYGHTFEIDAAAPVTYRSAQDLAHYRDSGEGEAARYVPELLRYFKVDRHTCRSIYVIVVMNPHENYPRGAGRPINGGLGTGGGALALSSYALDNLPNFQSLLQHELGHTFGLPHVEAYGYDMKTSDSIMAYNPKHHTKGFQPSPTPGILLPEDRRALAMNQRVFPGLTFDPARDVPPGYQMKKLSKLAPMDL